MFAVMRPRFLALSLMIVAVSSAGVADARVRLGLEGGARYGDATGGFGDAQPAPSWSLGAVAEAPIARQWSVVSGVRYLTHHDNFNFNVGGTATAPGSPQVVEVENALDYVTVPIRLAFRPRGGLVLEAGADTGYRLDARSEARSDGMTIQSSASVRFARIFEEVGTLGADDLYDKWNVAFTAGAGWDFPWANQVMTLRLRYEQGLSNLHPAEYVVRHSRALALDAGILW